MSKDELNRCIAESIEPKPITHPRGLGRTTKAWVFSDEFFIGKSGEPVMVGWTARDFHADEVANAWLLEMMPEVNLTKIRHVKEPRLRWRCDPYNDCEMEAVVHHADRKTAICLAFAKWKGVEVNG